ncbi:NAD-dependent epimerase/dehydratase family protein [Candidatus Leptofilum sp.]|uniref:NAD-dependent epimerase/dehydratase family protein n=1 Tax=Candidatus Leptofilum sp. TaxID=3241576 RepID=UPI003B5CEE03
MKVVVTGATGFVGGALVRALLADGHEVVGVKRPSATTTLQHPNLTWRSGDVTDPASLRSLFDEADSLIHAAGMLGQAGVPESDYLKLHEQGTYNILAEAEKAGVGRVLYVSSPGVLGPISSSPADETTPLAPSNPYERSKAAAEQVAQVYASAGLPVIIARPEFIYGPTDLHVLGLFKAVRDGRFFTINGGHNTCHPTYIDDAVLGMLLALRNGRSGEIYHITGPKPVTFRELGQRIAAALDVPSPKLNLPHWLAWLGAAGLEIGMGLINKRPPLSRTGVAFFSEDRRFSWQKAHDELGYTPQFDLELGVAETVAWYRENGLV